MDGEGGGALGGVGDGKGTEGGGVPDGRTGAGDSHAQEQQPIAGGGPDDQVADGEGCEAGGEHEANLASPHIGHYASGDVDDGADHRSGAADNADFNVAEAEVGLDGGNEEEEGLGVEVLDAVSGGEAEHEAEGALGGLSRAARFGRDDAGRTWGDVFLPRGGIIQWGRSTFLDRELARLQTSCQWRIYLISRRGATGGIF